MERRCIGLGDLAIGDIEAAIGASGPSCIVVCQGQKWAVVNMEQLRAEDLEAIESARESGYVVATGSNPWPVWDAWWLLCQVSGQYTVRAWQRPGNRRGVVELVLPAGHKMAGAPGPLWDLASEYAGTVLGTDDWLMADGVPRAQVERLASEIAQMAHTGAVGNGAG